MTWTVQTTNRHDEMIHGDTKEREDGEEASLEDWMNNMANGRVTWRVGHSAMGVSPDPSGLLSTHDCSTVC